MRPKGFLARASVSAEMSPQMKFLQGARTRERALRALLNKHSGIKPCHFSTCDGWTIRKFQPWRILCILLYYVECTNKSFVCSSSLNRCISLRPTLVVFSVRQSPKSLHSLRCLGHGRCSGLPASYNADKYFALVIVRTR